MISADEEEQEEQDLLCDRIAVLEAWVRERPAPSRCPERLNNYVVKENPGTGRHELFNRKFVVESEDNCCYFDNDIQNLVSLPPICNAIKGSRFTTQELNVKPYRVEGELIRVLNPVCDDHRDCITLELNNSTMRYQITSYRSESSGTGPADKSALFIPDIELEITSSCGELIGLYYRGQLMTRRTTSGIENIRDWDHETREPMISQDILEIFNNEAGFSPIPRIRSF